ncbi:MAG: ACT domain-containing protein, partial [Gammaproteobacteria bacterium]
TAVEFQIRTEPMHAVAEAGIAAHWMYKVKDDNGQGEAQRLGAMWLQSLVDIQDETRDANEFLEHVKIDLFPDAVYVFTPRGEIDFAYSVHTDIGDHAVAARVNQQSVPLRTELQNGDVVEVITAPNSKANPNWLSFVRTGKARAGIRHCLKTLKYRESVELGRRLLDHALRTLRIDPATRDPQTLERGARDAAAKSVEELYTDIGLGKRLAPVVARTIALQFAGKSAAATLILPRPAPMLVSGNEGAAVSYSPCCYALPGDDITEHLRGGHGLVVHRVDCKVARRQRGKDAERWIDVDWAEEVSGQFRTEIEVAVRNDRGVLGKVAAEIAASEANIVHVAMDEDAADSATIQFAILVRDRVHLARVMRNVRRLSEVARIARN